MITGVPHDREIGQPLREISTGDITDRPLSSPQARRSTPKAYPAYSMPDFEKKTRSRSVTCETRTEPHATVVGQKEIPDKHVGFSQSQVLNTRPHEPPPETNDDAPQQPPDVPASVMNCRLSHRCVEDPFPTSRCSSSLAS